MSRRYDVRRRHFLTARNCRVLMAVHCEGEILAGELGSWVDGEPACGACTEHVEITNQLMDQEEGTDG